MMGIYERKVFGIQCNSCGQILLDADDGYCLWSNKDTAVEEAKEEDWVFIDEECYCPNCHGVDSEDDDTIIVKRN